MADLAKLTLRAWWGGANGGTDQSGEWVATGGYTFELQLTDWPRLRESFSPFTWGSLEDSPMVVKAKLRCSGRYGASVSIDVDQCHWKQFVSWGGHVSVASAKRRALAFLYDRQAELVHDALRAFWAGQVHGPRTLIVDETGTPIATFPNSSDAFNSNKLPRHFFQWRQDRDGTHYAREVTRSGSTRSSGGSPELTKRVRSLLEAGEVSRG